MYFYYWFDPSCTYIINSTNFQNLNKILYCDTWFKNPNYYTSISESCVCVYSMVSESSVLCIYSMVSESSVCMYTPCFLRALFVCILHGFWELCVCVYSIVSEISVCSYTLWFLRDLCLYTPRYLINDKWSRNWQLDKYTGYPEI